MSNFVFLTPYWLLAIIPLAAFLLWLRLRNQQQTLIAPHLAKAMGLGSQAKQSTILSVLSLAWLLACIALAGPSFQKQARPTYSNGSARVLVMDMSMSQYATDVSPNRLTQERYKALDLLNGWHDGYTGLVAFAAGAYTVSPMTSDASTIKNLVPNLSPEIMPAPGSNVVAGVKKAITMMENAGMAKGDIVLLTDDIDSDQSSQIKSLLSGTHWHLSVLAMGTESGAPIQLTDGSLMKNGQGDTIVAKIDFDTMRALTQSVNGVFVPYRGDGKDVDTILANTQAVKAVKGKNGTRTVTERINNGYWLVFIIMIPALLLFRRGVIFIFALVTLPVLMMPQQAEAAPFLNQNQQAYQAFKNKEYKQAASLFTDPKWQGIAKYKAGDYPGAIDSLSQVKHPDEDTQYNLANAYAQAQQLDKAEQLYKQILAHNPTNKDAKHNLQIVEQAKKKQKQQQKNQQGKNQSNQQNKQDKSSSNDQKNSGSKNKNQSQGDKSHQDQKKQNNQQGQKNQDKSAQQDSSKTNNKQSQQENHNQSQPAEKNKSQDKDKASQQQASANKSQDNNDSAKSADQKQAQQAKQAQAARAKQQDNKQKQSQQAVAAEPSSAKKVDPALRKLEQVESVRDPSQLLRAQLYLQAQDQDQPDTQTKKW